MSTPTPEPGLGYIKGCADVVIHTVRALADALEACQANGGGCSCGCCCRCAPDGKAA